jgi:hypothetical protein
MTEQRCFLAVQHANFAVNLEAGALCRRGDELDLNL